MMARRAPTNFAPPPFQETTTRVEWRLKLRFVTPVIGGGVDAGTIDRETPIRGSAVKGQLRFWWRAVNPSGCPSLDELSVREAEVFGSAMGPDPRQGSERAGDRRGLRVTVLSQPPPPTEIEFDRWKNEGNRDAREYGGFALRQGGRVYRYARTDFELLVSAAPDVARDAAAAIWAWLEFGGLGARTRRGFGAIDPLDVQGPGLPTSYVDALRTGRDGVPWPHLRLSSPPVRRAPKRFRSAEDALDYLLSELRRFRQGVGTARSQGQARNRPGRSHWPEADAIRRRTRHAPGHAPRLRKPDAFPRAALGLPILTEFRGNAQDPPKTTLSPEGADRLASPLILRPQLGADGRWRACAVRLHQPPLDRAVLTGAGAPQTVRIVLSAEEARAVEPLVIEHRVHTDPIDAFLHFFGSQT